MRIACLLIVGIAALSSRAVPAFAQAPMGTAFTYQGQLKLSGAAITGDVDVQFTLWDAATLGSMIAGPVTELSVPVADGLFDVDIDFGEGPFNGEARWLEILVRSPAGAGAYTTLDPRQELTPVPYAIYARKAQFAFDLAPPVFWSGAFAVPTLGSANSGPGDGIFAGYGAIAAPPANGGGNAIYSLALTGHALFATDADVAAPAGNDLIYVMVNNVGKSAVVLRNGNAANATATLDSSNSGNGHAITAATSGTGAGVSATSAGGNAVFAGDGTTLPPVPPTRDAIYAAALTRHAVYATNGVGGPFAVVHVDADGDGDAIDGIAVGMGKGVKGDSRADDGVFGTTSKIGTFANGNSSIVAGVQGSSADVDDIDNFGVAGVAGGYGTGVLGIGNGGGHGVLGVCGNEFGFVNAGVRGVTRENQAGGFAYPPYFALRTTPDKDMVGVLGQSATRVGVWGESLQRIGVVGNSGDELSLAQTPTDPVGVYGVASQDNAAIGVLGVAASSLGGNAGVEGRSSSDDRTSAGVRAVGNGAGKAAALEIANGAITVSGTDRPAGTIDLTRSPAPGPSACTLVVDGTITNALIRTDSIILLTLETGPGSADGSLSLMVLEKFAGSATVRLQIDLDDLNADGVCNLIDLAAFLGSYSITPKVDYLVINPN